MRPVRPSGITLPSRPANAHNSTRPPALNLLAMIQSTDHTTTHPPARKRGRPRKDVPLMRIYPQAGRVYFNRAAVEKFALVGKRIQFLYRSGMPQMRIGGAVGNTCTLNTRDSVLMADQSATETLAEWGTNFCIVPTSNGLYDLMYDPKTEPCK
jgi:hypothetical protein